MLHPLLLLNLAATGVGPLWNYLIDGASQDLLEHLIGHVATVNDDFAQSRVPSVFCGGQELLDRCRILQRHLLVKEELHAVDKMYEADVVRLFACVLAEGPVIVPVSLDNRCVLFCNDLLLNRFEKGWLLGLSLKHLVESVSYLMLVFDTLDLAGPKIIVACKHTHILVVFGLAFEQIA